MKPLSLVWYLGIYLVLALSTTTLLSAQSTIAPANKFAQFYVVGISSAIESRTIDAAIRTKKGVLISRTDHNTRLLFCIFPEQSAIDQNHFIAWLNELGYQISCYREGIHGVDKVYAKEEYQCD